MSAWTPQRFIEARQLRGLACEDVARLVSVPYATTRNWETGAAQPSRHDIDRLSWALKFPPAWFAQPERERIPIKFSTLGLHAPIKESDYCVADHCGDLADYLCDQRGDEGQYICSRPLCGQHAVLINGEDFCPKHVEGHLATQGVV